MQEYEKYQELLNQKHKMEEQFQRKGNGFILDGRSFIVTWPSLIPKNKIRSKESETEQKHNAVLQELEDDYEKRLADKGRQLEDKVKYAYKSIMRTLHAHLTCIWDPE